MVEKFLEIHACLNPRVERQFFKYSVPWNLSILLHWSRKFDLWSESLMNVAKSNTLSPGVL